MLILIWLIVFSAAGARTVQVGANGVTLGYIVDMSQLLLPGASYTKAWCDGNLVDCHVKYNYPGQGTTSIMGWDDVYNMGALTPEKVWSGEWWRGNELGFIINNPFFWSLPNVINPMSIQLGSLPMQYSMVRPIAEAMFDIGSPGSESYSRAESITRRWIGQFLASRQTFSVGGTDINALVHQILNEYCFNRIVSWEYAQAFVEVQQKVTAMATLSQILPAFLYARVLGARRSHLAAYVDEYTALLEQQYSGLLSGKDCSPSESCARQAAFMVWDGMYAAGGLSVPSAINTGLGVLYSTDASNPFLGGAYAKSQAAQFYWESLRYFPPVVGFPHWEVPPTCAGLSAEQTLALRAPEGRSRACPFGAGTATGYPAVNQYKGGARVVPNLALAQRDPLKWGPDAGQFVLRDLQTYDHNSVGFAEMAVNAKVANGTMNMVCPGKSLALVIGSIFFELFDRTAWRASTTAIKFKGVTPFVDSFDLISGSNCFRFPPLVVAFLVCVSGNGVSQ